jgi:hypothetical protein
MDDMSIFSKLSKKIPPETSGGRKGGERTVSY